MADNGGGRNTPPQTLEAGQGKVKVKASGSDSVPFEIRSGVRQGCALSPTLFNCIIDWILGQALPDYPGVQVGANVHVSDLAYRNTQLKIQRDARPA